MEINVRLEQILKQLEEDRQRALAEYANIQADLAMANPQFKHLSREVGVQALRLAVDASINMAKAISTLTKDQPQSGIGVDRKELLNLLESVDKDIVDKVDIEEKPTEISDPVTDELLLDEEREVAEEDKLLAEIDEIIDASKAEAVQP